MALSHRQRRERVAAWCDGLVLAGLVFAIVFGPFAFGSVHPQAYGLLEIVAGLLALVTLTRLWFCGPPRAGLAVAPRRLWLPLAGFLAVVALQLLPLPPGVLRVVSPSTYELYSLALPGWPEKAPYEDTVRALLARDDLGVQPEDLARPVRLPTVEEVEKYDIQTIVPDAWGRLPGEPLLDRHERQALERWVERDHRGFFSSWRTLSLDPARTWAELLKIVAYLLVFAVVTFYPLEPGSREEARFQRRLLRAVAITAVAVAAVGLLQRFSWNGKILWFFVPWDWGEPRLLHPQTSGPFVSRNNFGGYLAMTLPLVLVPVLARTRIDLRRPRVWTQALFGMGAAVVGTALFFSLSRGSWGAAAVSLIVLIVALLRGLPADKRAGVLRSKKAGLWAGTALVAVMLLFVLMPTGGSEMGSDIDRRLEQTVSSAASWEGRVENWRDSVPMIADFPLFGVGLSTWGAVFPKYDESFFFGNQARRAHNDYIQILSETGLIGAGFLFLAGFFAVRRFLRVLRDRSDSSWAVHVAMGCGLVALLVHAFVDFDLQMPAIALTGVLLLGLALCGGWRTQSEPAPSSILLPSVGLLSLLYLLTVFSQSAPTANSEPPSGLLASLRSIDRRPANSSAHLAAAVGFAEVETPLARPALDVAVALNPTSPGPRDTRALVAAEMGDTDLALADIEESMYRAPSRAQHPLLGARTAAWLSPESRVAVERGFQRAVDGAGYRAAVALAGFYSGADEHKAAAQAWQQAAQLAPRQIYAAGLLRRAGWELLQGDDLDGAEVFLRQSIVLAPAESGARGILMARVFGPRGDLQSARAARKEALAAGADPYEIDLALAEAARFAKDSAFEIDTLRKAAALRPDDVRGHYRLGLAHFRLQEYPRASQAFQAATRASSGYAPAWYYLGLTAERNYDFALAAKAFAEATRLDPQNSAFRKHQQRFTTRFENS